MFGRGVRGSVVLVLAAMIAGCGSAAAPAATPAPSLPAGWTQFRLPSQGFAIALPPHWQHLDLTVSKADVQAALQDNPKLAAAFKSQEFSQNVKFYGADQEGAGTGFASNLNLQKLPGDSSVTLDAIVPQVVAALKDKLDQAPTQERVHLPAGDAERLTYHLTVTLPDGSKVVTTVTQYLFIHGGSQPAIYILTLVAPTQSMSQFGADFDGIARSFQIF